MDYKIHYDFSVLDNLDATLGGALRPVLSGIVGKVANSVYKDWVDKVEHAGGKGGIRQDERDSYAGSISISYKEGDLSAMIYTPFEQASQIEEGRPAYDLKQMLNTSDKVRRSKNGKRYLIIPFRHNTSGAQAMPSAIYKAAKALPVSKVTGRAWLSNGFGGGGIYTDRATYKWGGRLPSGMSEKLKPWHATDIHAGMVKMDTSAGKAKSSAYLTFRVMVEGSDKWIIPARPGLYIVRDVVARGQALMNAEVGSALKG